MILIGRNGHEEEVEAANPNSTVRVTIPNADMEVLDMIRKVKSENPGAEKVEEKQMYNRSSSDITVIWAVRLFLFPVFIAGKILRGFDILMEKYKK